MGVTVACVLKTGRFVRSYHPTEYRREHVQWLRDQVSVHAGIEYRFVCLSDVTVPGVETIPLEQGWPGWWSKLELFRHDLGAVVYFDLDTVICGPLAELLQHPHQFTALRSLARRGGTNLNSGLMAWNGPRPDIYEAFRKDAAGRMREGAIRGDQWFLNDHVGKWQAWQDLFPGRVVSFKTHLNQKLPPPAGASVVCFHGKPRPWEVRRPWIALLSA